LTLKFFLSGQQGYWPQIEDKLWAHLFSWWWHRRCCSGILPNTWNELLVFPLVLAV